MRRASCRFRIPLPGEVIAKDALPPASAALTYTAILAKPSSARSSPFHIGHEICARVTAVGDGVQTVAPEDIIVVNPFFTCGACTPCYMGQENGCEHKTTIGLKGFMADFPTMFAYLQPVLFRCASDNYPAMSLAEPLSTVIYGYESFALRQRSAS